MSSDILVALLTIAGAAFCIYAAKRDERVKAEYDKLIVRIRNKIKA